MQNMIPFFASISCCKSNFWVRAWIYPSAFPSVVIFILIFDTLLASQCWSDTSYLQYIFFLFASFYNCYSERSWFHCTAKQQVFQNAKEWKFKHMKACTNCFGFKLDYYIQPQTFKKAEFGADSHRAIRWPQTASMPCTINTFYFRVWFLSIEYSGFLNLL